MFLRNQLRISPFFAKFVLLTTASTCCARGCSHEKIQSATLKIPRACNACGHFPEEIKFAMITITCVCGACSFFPTQKPKVCCAHNCLRLRRLLSFPAQKLKVFCAHDFSHMCCLRLILSRQ